MERIYCRAKPGNILLQELSLEVESPAQCGGLTGASLGPGLLCASQEPCQADGGGGLLQLAEDGQSWLQLGIITSGRGCAGRDVPGEVYQVLEVK